MPITRRNLLGLLSGGTVFLSVSHKAAFAADLPATSVPLDFPQGVASADPQPDAVMLWTRAVPRTATEGPVTLLLQLSRDSDFSTLLLQAPLQADAGSDYTVRSYIDGLDADTRYYYRFVGGDGDTGRSLSRTGSDRRNDSASPGGAD